MATVLVVDDDENICTAFRHFLEEEGHVARFASTGEEGLVSVEDDPPDLIIMDIRMPGIGGLQALEILKKRHPEIHVVIMTAYGTSQTSIDASRLGAFDYLMKPLDLDEIRSVINRALRASASIARAKKSDEEQWADYRRTGLVGKGARMQEIYRLIGALSTNSTPMLITGEPGVGKKLVAQTIHQNSSRSQEPFLTIPLRELAQEDFEVEIFGRSATAALPAVVGKLIEAGNGTLLLDAVDQLPLSAQARIARFIATGKFEAAGARSNVPGYCRLIATTSEDLSLRVEQGDFSRTFYELLTVVPVSIPPLRNRKEDLPDLVMYFIQLYNQELGKEIQALDKPVRRALEEYSWPGNVTELRNLIKRACILARSKIILMEDLGDSLGKGQPALPTQTASGLENAVRRVFKEKVESQSGDEASIFHDIIEQVEVLLIKEALALTGGNQVKAAQLLSLNRTTLRKKIGA